MAFQTLLTELRDRTLYITINRPEVLNALNRQVLVELDELFNDVISNDAIAGVILTGSGEKSFVAGADISEIYSLDEPSAYEFSKFGQSVFAKIENCEKPVIAAVNGFALGGGCELAMACHLRIAAENARFGQPEVKLGLIAGYGGTQRLPRLIGRAKALELLLTADMIDAAEAHRLGLVNYTVPREQLISRTEEILKKIYAMSPLAVGLTIHSVNEGMRRPKSGFKVEADNFSVSASSNDGKEGTKAFMEKRPASFTGN